jgi:hypothetical protein
MHFLDRQPATVESAEHDAPAFRAEIAGDVMAVGGHGAGIGAKAAVRKAAICGSATQP